MPKNGVRIARALVLAGVVVLAIPAIAGATWNQPVGGASPINESPSHNADAVALANVKGTPYVAWDEDTTQPGQGGSSSQIRVARLAADGQSWEKVGDTGTNPISRLDSTSSANPDITSVSGVPWVAWSEGVSQTDAEIRVAKYDSASRHWVRVVDTDHPINHLRPDTMAGGGHADNPTIVDGGSGRPYVSFFEADPGTGSHFFPNSAPAEVWVDRLSADGTQWDEVGGGPVSDPNFDAAMPKMTMAGDVPWLVYFQVALVNQSPELQIQVAHLSSDGQSWVHVGTVASGSPNEFDNPTIATIAGTPYLAFGDRGNGSTVQIRVLKLDGAGTGWDDVGGGPVTNPSTDNSHASLADVRGTPWVTWLEGGNGPRQVRMAHLVGGAWQIVPGQINNDSSKEAGASPDVESIHGFPWVAFTENDGQVPGGQNAKGCCDQVRVSRLEPDFTSSSAQPQSTSATLLATLDTYGLPYPVTFEWGTTTKYGHTSSVATASGDPATVFTQISGLRPSTLYHFRVVATAGTPGPKVYGPSGSFVTSGDSSPFYIAPVGHSRAIDRGHTLRVRFIVSQDARVKLVIRRGSNIVFTKARSFAAGEHHLAWPGTAHGHPAAAGHYRLILTARNSSGRRVEAGAGSVTVR